MKQRMAPSAQKEQQRHGFLRDGISGSEASLCESIRPLRLAVNDFLVRVYRFTIIGGCQGHRYIQSLHLTAGREMGRCSRNKGDC